MASAYSEALAGTPCPNQVPLSKANCLWLRASETSVANIGIAISNLLGNEAFHSNTFLLGHLIFILVVSKKKKDPKGRKMLAGD